MAVAPRSSEPGNTNGHAAANTMAAPTGPLIVPPIVPAVAPGDAQPVLSLVVPTLNESENIGDFLAAVAHLAERDAGADGRASCLSPLTVQALLPEHIDRDLTGRHGAP